jgi:hypothetical protein
LALNLDSPMTDAGGTIDLVSNNNALAAPWDVEASCWDNDNFCGGAAAPYRYLVDGDVTTANITPEPGTLLLALPLCALFVGMRRQLTKRLGWTDSAGGGFRNRVAVGFTAFLLSRLERTTAAATQVVSSRLQRPAI